MLFRHPLLFSGPMVEAELQQWIAQQAVRLDRVVANFTEAESACVEPCQRFVHALEELLEGSMGNVGDACGLQARAPALQLGVKIRLGRIVHTDSLLLCACGFHPLCTSKFGSFREGTENHLSPTGNKSERRGPCQ